MADGCLQCRPGVHRLRVLASRCCPPLCAWPPAYPRQIAPAPLAPPAALAGADGPDLEGELPSGLATYPRTWLVLSDRHADIDGVLQEASRVVSNRFLRGSGGPGLEPSTRRAAVVGVGPVGAPLALVHMMCPEPALLAGFTQAWAALAKRPGAAHSLLRSPPSADPLLPPAWLLACSAAWPAIPGRDPVRVSWPLGVEVFLLHSNPSLLSCCAPPERPFPPTGLKLALASAFVA